MKRILSVLLTFVMVTAAFSGCGGNAGTTDGTSAGTTAATTASTTAPATTQPAADNFNETSVLNLDWFSGGGTDSMLECPWVDIQCLYHELTFDPLVRLDLDGKTMLPRLASSFSVSPDGMTYTFEIRDGVKWHDGTAFTAEDVLFTYNTVLKVPESFIKNDMLGIEGAQDVIDGNADTMSGVTISGNSVVVKLSTADNSIIMNVFGSLYILPKHLLESVDPTLFKQYEAFWKHPIGTGPYKIVSVTFPTDFQMTINEDYYGAKPQIKNIAFISHATGGVESTIADIIAGNIDYAYGNAVNDINRAKDVVAKNPDVKMVMIPSSYQRQLWFNNVGSTDGKYNPDVQKVEVRQALNLLIDKEAFAGFYAGQAVPMTTCVNPGMSSYNASIPIFKRDVAKAKEMLDAAGFDYSRPLRLLYYYDDQTTADVMELVKQNFAEAGVILEPFLATGDLASIIYEVKNWDILYGGTGSGDPILVCTQLVPDNGIMDGLFGDVQFRNETFGKLIKQYKSLSDPVEMKKVGDQIQLEANQYCMAVPIYGLNQVLLYNSAKLTLDESIFTGLAFTSYSRDIKIDTWQLLK